MDFKIKERNEQFFSIYKYDLFTLQLIGKKFRDSLELVLHSSDEGKPLYYFYTLTMKPDVDTNFVKFLNTNPDSTIFPKNFPGVKIVYYSLEDSIKLRREIFKETAKPVKIRYWLNYDKTLPITISKYMKIKLTLARLLN